MRNRSAFPNRQHTPDTLRDELTQAERAGSATEIADLALLVANAERPKGAPKLPGAGPAGNRQAQRRYQRNRTWDTSSHNTARRTPRVGDYMLCPDKRVYLISHIEGDDYISHDVPGARCHISQLTIVDGPDRAPAPELAPAKESHVACEALLVEALAGSETFYQGVWDAYEVQDWAALERALRAYEARLAALGV